jgi:hypothetical protein
MHCSAAALLRKSLLGMRAGVLTTIIRERFLLAGCMPASTCCCIMTVCVVQVNSCRLIGSRHFHGVDASGAGTRVCLRECLVSYNGKYGVVATHRAIVQLISCRSVSNAQAGVSAQERGEVRLSLCCSCHRISRYNDSEALR